MKGTTPRLLQRAALHAALGDPVRLAIVDELLTSDRSPIELRRLVGLESNLLAHHLDVLEQAGITRRSRSSGDARRRYVCMVPGSLAGLTSGTLPGGSIDSVEALFVCSANSARSQLAAALWRTHAGASAESAGTHPAARIHPGARAAAKRADLDLGDSVPQALSAIGGLPPIVVTVCDQAHEELDPDTEWLHWSIPDPVAQGTTAAFDATVVELRMRIASLFLL